MIRAATIFFVLGLISLLMGLNDFGALSGVVGQILLGLALLLGAAAVVIALFARRQPSSLT